MYLIEFIVAFIITISVHEIGHMIAAILSKIEVRSVALGFGKTLLKVRIKGIDFKLNLFPLGGYTELIGEEKDTPDGFLSKKYWIQWIVALSGVFMNVCLACVCYLIHYGSITTGIIIDCQTIVAIFTKDYSTMWIMTEYIVSSRFLFLLSLMNILTLANMLPILPLDGGLMWVSCLKKLFPKNYVAIKKTLSKYGLIFLIIAQIILILYLYIY